MQERIKDSRLKEILSAELTDLLATRPAAVPPDEFITAAAVLIVRELKSEMIKNGERLTPDQTAPRSPAPLDCETIINGLLIGMHHDLLESNLQMVKALGSAIAERDYGTREHNYRVTIYSVQLAEQMDLAAEQIRALIKGSFLHDIGKVGIRDKTLLKPGGLTEREYEDVKRHVSVGKQIIENVRWLEDAVDVILYHHEKWDGSGYPDGRVGEDIPLAARIFSIADVFDALTSERPYKRAVSYADTIATMTAEQNIRFDPRLLDQFVKISKDLYEKTLPMDLEELEDTVLGIINRHFQFGPTVDDLRDSFGSIARPGNNSGT
ncbi:MAG: HD-GYP domain-containing protein [Candidatus Zixiibacteriota bacterium]|nr:MAG: HD-GYP domain-containing protein [candidate division Zixibacteria bacterium]